MLAVGIGNTTVKIGLTTATTDCSWPSWQFLIEIPTEKFDPSALRELLPAEQIEWFVASVQRATESQLCDWVKSNRRSDSYRLLGFRDLPIQVAVDAPERVGADRLCAAVAVNRRRGDRPAVVVDAGTAITVNLVSSTGSFEGGVILPGFGLTAKALAVGTDLLPLIAPNVNSEPPSIVGKSTEAAIRSGLFWGNVGAVRETVERMSAVLGVAPAIFVTGGDAQRLAGFLASDAQFIPDLVLAGVTFSALHLKTAYGSARHGQPG